MKKFLLSLLIGATCLPAFADEAATTEFGYCTDPNIYIAQGIGYDYQGNIGIAIRVPASAIKNYKGGKIIGMTIGAADGCHDQEIRAFLRKGSLTEGEDVASTTEYITWTPYMGYMGKLNTVLFDSSWVIPEDLEEDVFLGLYTTVEPQQNVIGVSAYTNNAPANSVFVSDTQDVTELSPSNWDDITTVPSILKNNPVMRCIIELPSDNYENSLQLIKAYTANIAYVGKQTSAYFLVKNDGTKPISSFEYVVSFGEESYSKRITFEGEPMPIGYVTANRGGMEVPLDVLGSGTHTITITKVNDQENVASKQDASKQFEIIGVPVQEAIKHIRRPVYEFFCSEDDYRSGTYQDDIVIPSLAPFKGRYTYLPHHSDDKFSMDVIDTPAIVNGEQTTIPLGDAERWAIKLANGIQNVYIPSVAIDRTIQMQKLVLGGEAMVSAPLSSTPYPEAMKYFMPDALNVPTFATVELESEYNAETNLVTIKASGTIADLLPNNEKAKLSIFIVEENVKSDSQEFPDNPDRVNELYPDGIFTHWRVIRQKVTDFYGDELEPGKDFVKTYSAEIENPRWNTDHMKVVAIIQRPETNDCMHMDIINSAEEPMSATYEESGISSVEVSTEISGGIFDLQGRRLSVPARGINIINGKKILVK